ncbi:MAG: hypothetical protein JWN38_744 [Candidatus Saccharibacteria bacterium]|nr:hypothetical protein [Candidatus Saccharibacteria bacterium]
MISSMLNYSVRFLKRFIVLVPGIIIAYISVRNIFPYFDQRLPLGFAILATWVLGAYVLVPFLIRVVRIFLPAKHLPLYCVTPDGFASDPLNIGIVGTRRQLLQAMEAAGWQTADPRTLRALVHQLYSFVFEEPYPTAPMSHLYLFGRRQDLAFEIALKSGTNRHHVRFWATTFTDSKQLSVASIHWHHRKTHVQGDNLLWVGAASLDAGLAPIKHNLQITHMIHPDTNQERELIVSQLRAAKVVKKVTSLKLQKPTRLNNRALRGYLHTDGRMAIIDLKPAAKR